MTDEQIEQMEAGFKAAMEQEFQPDRVILGKYIMSPGMATPENIARIGRGEAPIGFGPTEGQVIGRRMNAKGQWVDIVHRGLR